MDVRHRLNQPSRRISLTFAAVPVLLVFIFAITPAITLSARALANISDPNAVAARRAVNIVLATLAQASVSTVATVVIGVLPGIVVARHHFRGRATLLSFMTAVFVLPTVVMAAGIQAVLPEALERGWIAVVTAHVVFNVAVVVRIVGTTPMPAALEQTARTLGASPMTVMRTITLPLVSPAIAASAAIVFALSFTSYGVVRILGGIDATTIEVEIWRQTVVFGRIDRGVVLAIVQVLVLGALALSVFSLRRLFPEWHFEPGERTPLPRRARAVLLPVVGLVTVPMVALAIGSLRVDNQFRLSAWTSLGDTSIRPGLDLGVDPVRSLGVSAATAAVASTISVAVALCVVAALACDRRIGKVADVTVMAPLGISAVTIGLGMLITFDTWPIDWRSGALMVPIGHALVATPFVVRSAVAALRSVSGDSVDVASTLGAPPLRARITAFAPAVVPALATGAGLAVAISLGEFGATSLLSRSGSETLPLVIDRLLARTGGDFRARAHALSVILTTVVVASTIGVERLLRSRRVGQ
ncbi:MAG: ABC transporter permease subunit [Actinomycetota bacterium]|nr:ABC transporter permease subunit [Actinomycetota bacterium]MDA3028382.1 ABC transporter permease subunit [Actinomycetota bacterium]